MNHLAPAPTSPIARWLPRLVLVLAIALLAWAEGRAALLFAHHAWACITFPFPLDYGEGPILDQAARLASFENIYRASLAAPPFTVSNYPPVFVAAQVPFTWIWGPAFWYGRALSLLGIMAATLFVGLTIHTLTGDTIAAVAGAVTLPAFPFILHWGAFDRVDSFALGLSWAGLWLISRWPLQRRGLLGGGLLLVAAIFTRQTYGLAAPLAAFTWLLGLREWRRALWLTALVGGVSVVLAGLLQLVTWGGFSLNIVTANVNPFTWGEVRNRADDVRHYLPFMVCCAAACILVAPWLRERSCWLTIPYLIGATASAATIGKAGSNVNYLFELSAALALATGAAIALLGRNRPYTKAALLGALALQVVIMAAWSNNDYVYRVLDKVERRAEIEQLWEIVRTAGGPVPSDEYMGMVPLAGQRLTIQPFEIKQLNDADLWDAAPFVAQIEQGAFPVILIYHPPDGYPLYEDRWPMRVLIAIDQRYEHVDTFADTFVYRPKPR